MIATKRGMNKIASSLMLFLNLIPNEAPAYENPHQPMIVFPHHHLVFDYRNPLGIIEWKFSPTVESVLELAPKILTFACLYLVLLIFITIKFDLDMKYSHYHSS